MPIRAQHFNEESINFKGYSKNQPAACPDAHEAVECISETWRS